MIFTSYTYLFFLAVTFVLYWTAPRAGRKPLLIAASYLFYGTWRWEYGFLLLGVSLFNWGYARWVLARTPTAAALAVGVAANLLLLIYFKYTGFLLGNAGAVVGWFGASWRPALPDILLPLGISFFTFQGIAYLVDVATGDEPLASLTDFLLFKAFWPQLIAGPIVRLHEMRGQLAAPPELDYADVAYGCRRILFGLAKKVVLADTLAPIVDAVFAGRQQPNALDCAVAAVGFGLQIYFDFSAYSDIAVGSARLFGFRFPENFYFPYAAASPQAFWTRWHMTLSRWIRDYVFTPLTFASRDHPWRGQVWLVVAMAGCGLWHGAQWTFVLWGVWHGLLLAANATVLRRLFPSPGSPGGRVFRWRHLPTIGLTYLLVTLGWVLFRANSLEQVGVFLTSLGTLRGGLRPAVVRENQVLIVGLIAALVWVGQMTADWWPRLDRPVAGGLSVWAVVRPAVYAALVLAVIVFDQDAKAFVYFQF